MCQPKIVYIFKYKKQKAEVLVVFSALLYFTQFYAIMNKKRGFYGLAKGVTFAPRSRK